MFVNITTGSIRIRVCSHQLAIVPLQCIPTEQAISLQMDGKLAVYPRSYLLVVFVLLGSSQPSCSFDFPLRNDQMDVTPEYIMTTLLTANAIGMLCARSLHYQFYSWTAWATPWLLWKAGFGPLFVYGVWAAQEWAWNVFPSTDISSMVAVGCLALQVLGVWWGTRKDMGDPTSSRQVREKKSQ